MEREVMIPIKAKSNRASGTAGRKLLWAIGVVLIVASCSQPPEEPVAEPTPTYAIPPVPSDHGSRGAPNLPRAEAGFPGVAPRRAAMPDQNWMLERQQEEMVAYDKNEDGFVSEEEYVNRHVERHKRRFDMIDANQDGRLTGEELADSMDPHRMMERARQPPPGRRPPP